MNLLEEHSARKLFSNYFRFCCLNGEKVKKKREREKSEGEIIDNDSHCLKIIAILLQMVETDTQNGFFTNVAAGGARSLGLVTRRCCRRAAPK
jgi:hypothetical protein